jgi:hypothetical protein
MFSLEVALQMDASRGALLRALHMPAPLAGLWAQYLGMFRAKGRALAHDRADKIMAELVPMLDAGTVVRNGNARQAALDLWRAALEQMVELRNSDRLQLPLKSHGYLLEIVFAAADRGAAKAEQAVEVTRQKGQHRNAANDRIERLSRLAQIQGDYQHRLIDRTTAELRLAAIDISAEALNGHEPEPRDE